MSANGSESAATGSKPQAKGWLLLWEAPGLIAFVIYIVISMAVLGCLAFDALYRKISWHRGFVAAIGPYAINSLAVAVPAALFSIVAGAWVAYRLRFVSGRQAVFPVMLLLAPFFSSPIGLYVGLKLVLGPSVVTYAIGLTFRYLPICVIVLLVNLYSLPSATKITLANLRVSEFTLFRRVVLRVMAPTASLLFALLILLMPLDIIGSTIAGGGKLQTFGNVVFDYSRTRDAQPTASLLTLGFLGIATVLLAVVIAAGTKRAPYASRGVAREGLLALPVRTVYLNPVFVLYVGAYIAILCYLFFQSAAVGSQYLTLMGALQTTAYIVLPITVMIGIVAMFVGCWFHLANIEGDTAIGKFIAATLLIPMLLPPVLAGRMAAVVQGLLDQPGGEIAVGGWYMYFFGSVPILVVLGHPLVFDRALAKVASNHRLFIDDYIYRIVVPALSTAIVIGATLFAAIAISDAVIIRYTGGSIKTLGLVLADHQAGVLAPGDYVFMGALGLSTLVALLMVGVMMFLVQKRRTGEESARLGMTVEAGIQS